MSLQRFFDILIILCVMKWKNIVIEILRIVLAVLAGLGGGAAQAAM